MSPLVFLAIPIAIFVVGSTVLWLASKWRAGGDLARHRAPKDLQTVAPMVRDQRQAGWQNGVGSTGYRG